LTSYHTPLLKKERGFLFRIGRQAAFCIICVGNEHNGETNKGGTSWELNQVQKERLYQQKNLIGVKEIIKKLPEIQNHLSLTNIRKVINNFKKEDSQHHPERSA